MSNLELAQQGMCVVTETLGKPTTPAEPANQSMDKAPSAQDLGQVSNQDKMAEWFANLPA